MPCAWLSIWTSGGGMTPSLRRSSHIFHQSTSSFLSKPIWPLSSNSSSPCWRTQAWNGSWEKLRVMSSTPQTLSAGRVSLRPRAKASSHVFASYFTPAASRIRWSRIVATPLKWLGTPYEVPSISP